jgi:hypothetical protein
MISGSSDGEGERTRLAAQKLKENQELNFA